MMNKKNFRTLEEFTTEYYGKKRTPKRDKLEKEYTEFKLDLVDSYNSTTQKPNNSKTH